MSQVTTQRDDWDQHWTEYAEAASWNPAQAMRRRVIHSLIQVPPGSARILDIGCGQGDLVQEMAGRYPNAQLCGVDYSDFGIDVAKEKVPGATFVQRDLINPEPPPANLAKWATHAVCSEVLEHVDQPGVLLSNARAYLSPGCRLVVTVPGGPMSAFDRHIGHRQHFSVDTLRRLLGDAGFAVDKVTGVGFPFFNLYRIVVISRGQRLVDEAAATSAGRPGWQVRLGLATFERLLSVPQIQSGLGWQMVAVARVPS